MIEVRNLTKKYGDHFAVQDISFSLEKGKIYGLLGPNGAGKSTTMNIMTGYIAATSGEVIIEGHDIFKEAEEAKKHIGYLPEIPPLYMDMLEIQFHKSLIPAYLYPLQDISIRYIPSSLLEHVFIPTLLLPCSCNFCTI